MIGYELKLATDFLLQPPRVRLIMTSLSLLPATQVRSSGAISMEVISPFSLKLLTLLLLRSNSRISPLSVPQMKISLLKEERAKQVIYPFFFWMMRVFIFLGYSTETGEESSSFQRLSFKPEKNGLVSSCYYM